MNMDSKEALECHKSCHGIHRSFTPMFQSNPGVNMDIVVRLQAKAAWRDRKANKGLCPECIYKRKGFFKLQLKKLGPTSGIEIHTCEQCGFIQETWMQQEYYRKLEQKRGRQW